MSVPFVGDIALIPFSRIPKDWLPCDGRTITAADNPSLVKVLGDRYGGDGVTTAALPDLRGRTPIGTGGGPGLTFREIGDQGGEAGHKLTKAEMPFHTHDLRFVEAADPVSAPGGNIPATGGAYANRPPKAPMAGGAVINTGNGRPHENRQPALALQWIIAAAGYDPFPS